jgi:hypothetical protein
VLTSDRCCEIAIADYFCAPLIQFQSQNLVANRAFDSDNAGIAVLRRVGGEQFDLARIESDAGHGA